MTPSLAALLLSVIAASAPLRSEPGRSVASAPPPRACPAPAPRPAAGPTRTPLEGKVPGVLPSAP